MDIIEIKGLKKDYPLGDTIVPALRGVDLAVAEGDFSPWPGFPCS